MYSLLFTLININTALGQQPQTLRGGLRSIPPEFLKNRKMQQAKPEQCDFVVPSNSNCFDTTRIGKGDVGCSNKQCQVKVCECDPYCCLLLWDASCAETNYFFPGCTARDLCCEEGSDEPAATTDAPTTPVPEVTKEIEIIEELPPLDEVVVDEVIAAINITSELEDSLTSESSDVVVAAPTDESENESSEDVVANTTTLSSNKNFSYFYI